MAVLCSNCAGKLIFNPASQKLECANCGAGYRPEDVRDILTTIRKSCVTCLALDLPGSLKTTVTLRLIVL